jgi:hypothetical protein
MDITKKWSASSKSEEIVGGEELAGMAGQWGVNIEISVTKPYSYSNGPIVIREVGDETQRDNS